MLPSRFFSSVSRFRFRSLCRLYTRSPPMRVCKRLAISAFIFRASLRMDSACPARAFSAFFLFIVSAFFHLSHLLLRASLAFSISIPDRVQFSAPTNMAIINCGAGVVMCLSSFCIGFVISVIFSVLLGFLPFFAKNPQVFWAILLAVAAHVFLSYHLFHLQAMAMPPTKIKTSIIFSSSLSVRIWRT